MKRLKRLIEAGNDAKILEYVKGDFALKIDNFIGLNDEFRELKKNFVRFAKESEQRNKERQDYKQKVDDMLSTFKN